VTTARQRGNANLLKLASILDKADAKHRARKEPTYDQSKLRHDCGTPACAFGHWVSYVNSRHISTAEKSKLTDFSRIAFNISGDEWSELFGMRGCCMARTAKDAAHYIRMFVARPGRNVA